MIKQIIASAWLLLVCVTTGMTQKYFTRTGNVSFYSDTPIEKIEALNKSANCVLDMTTGKLEFSVLVKGFQFEKALMQEHFNENYMESNTYPKAVFKGQIENFKKSDLSKNGKYTVSVTGDLTMHGVAKKVATEAVLEVYGDALLAKANFNVAVADYNISIPSLVKDKIAKTVKITVDAKLNPLNK
jgi:hypothetical protein